MISKVLLGLGSTPFVMRLEEGSADGAVLKDIRLLLVEL